MKLLNILLISIGSCILMMYHVYGQSAALNIRITDADRVEIGYIVEDVIYNAASNEPLVNVKGNLIFRSNSSRREDILLMSTVRNVYGRPVEKVIIPGSEKIQFTVTKGRFFWGDNAYKPGFLMLYIERLRDQEIVIFEGIHQRRIGFVSGGEPSASQWVALMYLFMLRYDLDQQIVGQNPAPPATSSPMAAGTIRLLFQGQGREFEFDGKVLRRRWMPNDVEDWIFDGSRLFRRWGDGREEFSWDGQTLQRRWYESNEVYTWNGRTIRWAYGDGRHEYIIQGNTVKRLMSDGRDDIWEIQGELPVPVIMMVIYGLTVR